MATFSVFQNVVSHIPIQLSDDGKEYRCEVSNAAGSENITFELHVTTFPSVTPLQHIIFVSLNLPRGIEGHWIPIQKVTSRRYR